MTRFPGNAKSLRVDIVEQKDGRYAAHAEFYAQPLAGAATAKMRMLGCGWGKDADHEVAITHAVAEARQQVEVRQAQEKPSGTGGSGDGGSQQPN